MKTISIINLKGGVAKTLTADSMAHVLATFHNKRVLLVDNDKQGEAWLRSRPEYPVFDTRIRYSDKVTESTFSEIPIVEYSRRSGTAMDYIAFVQEYLRRGKQ